MVWSGKYWMSPHEEVGTPAFRPSDIHIYVYIHIPMSLALLDSRAARTASRSIFFSRVDAAEVPRGRSARWEKGRRQQRGVPSRPRSPSFSLSRHGKSGSVFAISCLRNARTHALKNVRHGKIRRGQYRGAHVPSAHFRVRTTFQRRGEYHLREEQTYKRSERGKSVNRNERSKASSRLVPVAKFVYRVQPGIDCSTLMPPLHFTRTTRKLPHD